MAQFFVQGDLREQAKPVIIVDWETGDALGSAVHPVYVLGGTGGVLVDDGWTVDSISNRAGNASDKWWAVTGGQEWQILSVHLKAVTSATVGNRRFGVMWTDDVNIVLGFVLAGVTQAASLTYYYTFAPSLADLTTTRGTSYVSVMTPLPPTVILPAGYIIRVWDAESIATASDDTEVSILYAHRVV